MAKLVKYMGHADVRTIDKGETFGGQLAEGIPSNLKWDESNNWTLDADEVGLDEDALSVLLAEPYGDGGAKEFKDVSDLARIPFNAHQKTFRPDSRMVDNPNVSEATSDPFAGLRVKRLRELITEHNVQDVPEDADRETMITALKAAGVTY